MLKFKQEQLATTCTNLAQREVVEEGRGTVRLPEGEGRGVAGDFEASTTVLGCNLGLEGPPVLWVRVQSLEKGETTPQLMNSQKALKYHLKIQESLYRWHVSQKWSRTKDALMAKSH